MGDARQSEGVRRVAFVALAALVVVALSQCADPAKDRAAIAGATSTALAPARPSGPETAAATSAPSAETSPSPSRTASSKPEATPAATPQSPSRPALWQVTRIVDGDTIHVTRGGEVAKVRIIGIDSPEHDECGFEASVTSLRRIIGGREVSLVPGARTSRDQYGRLLRYVEAGRTDIGLAQIKSGYAVARFDSRDGYGAHPREVDYVAADRGSPDRGWLCATPVPVRPRADWPLPGDEHPCPQAEPIKGNESSMIAHSPGQQSYLVTNPEQCFATLSDAVAAGFRPAKR
jgi:endonuclease YncB( thermonuclease family)